VSRRIRVLAFLALAHALGLAFPAQALPRYTARYRQNCNLCHLNPTGGGLRSLYATQYLVPHEMSMKRFYADSLLKLDPQISESIRLGADLRTLHLYSAEDRPGEKNFFQMEGNVYLGFEPLPRFAGYVSRGQSGSLEIFGLAYLLPFNGYVKIGRFEPEFGWKFDDHTHFTREPDPQSAQGGTVFFRPPGQSDQGVEVGMFPKRFTLNAAVVNGNPGSSSSFDNNSDVAFAGRGLARFDFGSAGLGLGGSYWHNVEPAGVRQVAGPLGYLNWGRLTWVGEVDWSHLDPRAPQLARTQLLTSNEVSLQLTPGFDLLATFDYDDPNFDLQTGTRSRYGAGVDVLPTPFVSIQAVLNVFRFDTVNGGDITESNYKDYAQSQFQVHFFF
jgi:hypothetical protein